MSSNASTKKSPDRRKRGERRRGDGDNRRAHDRFSPAKTSNDRRQIERRSRKS
jgi:Xaa-Pro dipeptidase